MREGIFGVSSLLNWVDKPALSRWKKKNLGAQLCLTLCDPMDCRLPGSSARGILQASILEWVAMPFSRGTSQPRDRTQVCLIAGMFFTIWAPQEAQTAA